MAVANFQQPTRFGTRSTDDLVFKFILLDVLFFPYPPGLPITFGVIAAIIWPILSPRRAASRYFFLSIGLIVLAFLSFMRSLVFPTQPLSMHIMSNFINAGVLCFMAVLIFMIASKKNRWSFLGRNQFFVLAALKAYIIFKSILAIIFFLSPPQYFRIRSFWTYSENIIQVEDLSILTRFTGTLSDPNNYACIIVAVVAFVVFRQSEKLIQNVGFLLLASLSVVASMSVTGVAAFTIITMIYIWAAKLPGSTGTRIILRVAFILLISFVVFIIFKLTQDNAVLQLALQRVTESSTESRFVKFDILTDTEKVLDALFIGEGATIIWKNEEFRPHIGHLYMFLGFGLPAYVIFLFAFFPFSLRKPLVHALFLLPIFFGFSLNVGIYEPRFAAIWAILAGIYFIEPTKANSPASLIAGEMQPTDSHFSGRLV